MIPQPSPCDSPVLPADDLYFAAVFQASPEAMVITRTDDGVIVAVNEAVIAQTGYPREAFLGCSADLEAIGVWVYAPDRNRLRAAVRAGQPVTGEEIPFRMRDGSIRLGLVSAQPMRWGEAEYVVAVIRDITARVQAEQAQLEAARREGEARCRAMAEENARLLLESQNQALTQTYLLHEVNHRVKNNLAAILGLLQMELKFLRVEDPTPYQGMVSDLSARIQSLLLVHNLLSAAAEAPMPLSRLASNIMRIAPAMLPRQHAPVEMKISPVPVPLTPKQANALGLILNELTTNALKHAAREAKPIQLRLDIHQTGQQVNLVFRDNGPGYPAEVLQGERQSVGLYLIQTLIEHDLQGALELCNHRGAVARMTFDLDGQAPTASGPPEDASPGPTSLGS